MIILKELISHGADLNIVSGPDNYTPLMMAVSLLNDEAVTSLLRAGADKTLKDPNGNTVMDVAKEMDDEGIIAILNAEEPSAAAEES